MQACLEVAVAEGVFAAEVKQFLEVLAFLDRETMMAAVSTVERKGWDDLGGKVTFVYVDDFATKDWIRRHLCECSWKCSKRMRMAYYSMKEQEGKMPSG